ncbi:MAG TPA: VapA/VapB family virulence-associated protein [Verrucomicrobiae bacterium]|nr:VapA/VapB family virulence-associated protein [Verrucomicrobiae bacterium]
MTTQAQTNFSDRVADLKTMLAGTVPDKVLNDMVNAVQAAQTSYPANGSIASIVIWQRVQCTITGGKTFNGDSWGLSIPGGGALIGDVYLTGNNTLDTLYANTTGFAVTATPVYTAIYFLDTHGSTLGHFPAGSVSIGAGAGGGNGSWQ